MCGAGLRWERQRHALVVCLWRQGGVVHRGFCHSGDLVASLWSRRWTMCSVLG